MGEVPCRASVAPLASTCFVLCLIGVEAEGLLDHQGRAGIKTIEQWNLRPVIFGVEASVSFLVYDCNPHIQESHPRAPKATKSLKKVFPRSVKKVSKKSPNTDFVVFLTPFRVIWDFFNTFDTPGRDAREHPFETFCGFRARRPSRLLYMAAPIAILGTEVQRRPPVPPLSQRHSCGQSLEGQEDGDRLC